VQSNVSLDAEAVPQYIPPMTVSTDLDVYLIRVLPHSPSLVIIGGSLTVESYCGGRVTVRLTGETDCGWPFRFSQVTIPFINPGTAKFSMFVTIPPNVSTEPRTFTITAMSKTPGSGLFMNTTIFTIVPSHIYTGNIEPLENNCVKGEDGSARFPLRIWNTGNVRDIYRIDLISGGTTIDQWEGPLEVAVSSRGSL